MDWLVGRQETIEASLARRHLEDGSMVLYDLSSSWMEGNHCPLAHHGYSRDHKSGKTQIEYGLMTDKLPLPAPPFYVANTSVINRAGKTRRV